MSQTKVLTDTVLKGIMTDALVVRGRCLDLNADMETGIYSLYEAENSPVGQLWGLLVNITFASNIQAQVIFNAGGNAIYLRVCWDSWRSWQKIASSAIGT